MISHIYCQFVLDWLYLLVIDMLLVSVKWLITQQRTIHAVNAETYSCLVCD
jgi:hypothetical protein